MASADTLCKKLLGVKSAYLVFEKIVTLQGFLDKFI